MLIERIQTERWPEVKASIKKMWNELSEKDLDRARENSSLLLDLIGKVDEANRQDLKKKLIGILAPFDARPMTDSSQLLEDKIEDKNLSSEVCMYSGNY